MGNKYEKTNIHIDGLEIQERVYTHLNDNPGSVEWFGLIEDIHQHEDKATQVRGIDYTITSSSGILTADVKLDRSFNTTGNLLFEVNEISKGGWPKMGWGLYSQSKFIVFVNEKLEFGVVWMNDFRYIAIDYAATAGNKMMRSVKGPEGQTMIVLLVPEEICHGIMRKYKIGE